MSTRRPSRSQGLRADDELRMFWIEGIFRIHLVQAGNGILREDH
jgi:hypothetical protein